MKLIFVGLLPVVIFAVVEDRFGTTTGLIVTIVWSVLECLYQFVRYRQIDKITIVSTALVLILGGVGAWLEKGVLFKFQPVIMELLTCGLIVFDVRRENSVFLGMIKKARPELFTNVSPEVTEVRRRLLIKMSYRMAVLITVHAGVLAYLALNSSTAYWAFWKGFGLFVVFGLWFVPQFIRSRLKS